MTYEDYWALFRETGIPEVYLAFRQALNEESRKSE